MNVAEDKKRVQVTLTVEEYNQLDKLAKKDRRSLSATIAKLAIERLNELDKQ